MEKPANTEDKANELFFLLSSIDRDHILMELQKENLRTNELCKRLGMTSTEVIRQLHRLNDGGLLEKKSDGKYSLTNYAQLVLETSINLKFISKFREYFRDIDTSLLPPEFRARLGELSGATLLKTTIDTMNTSASMFKSAEEKIDVTAMGFEILLDITMQRLLEGVKVRWLTQDSLLPKIRVILQNYEKLPEVRSIPSVVGHVTLNEKTAKLILRRIDGTINYNYSLLGEDPSFLKWAGDLFEHEWRNAKPWTG